MELRIWINESETGENDEETILRTIAENAEEWYAKTFGGILETEVSEDDRLGANLVPGTLSVRPVSIEDI